MRTGHLFPVLLIPIVLASSCSTFMGLFADKEPAKKEALKPQTACRESAAEYADRMAAVIKTYLDKGYYTEASFLAADLKEASDLPARKSSELAALNAKVSEAFSPEKENSQYNSDVLVKAKDFNGKYGYVDQTGKFVIEAKYEKAEEFSEGLALVTLNEKSLFIDRTGKQAFAVEPKTEMFFFDAKEKTMLFSGNRKSGDFVSYDGSFPLPLDRIQVKVEGGFHGGLARVSLYTRPVSAPVKGGGQYEGRQGTLYLDKKGEERLFLHSKNSSSYYEGKKYRVEAFSDFREGFVLVSDAQKDRYVYLDTAGKPITEAEFNFGRPFNDGLACVRYANTDKWGYIDTKGKAAVKPFYTGDWVDMSDGVCVVHNPKAWAGTVVDAKGDVVFPMENKSTDNEHLDYIVKAQKSGDGLIGLARTTGAYYKNFCAAEFVDTKGKLRFSVTEYDGRTEFAVRPFSNGRAFIQCAGKGWGLIDTRGNYVLKPGEVKFEPVAEFRNGLAAVKAGGRKALMNRNGKIVHQE